MDTLKARRIAGGFSVTELARQANVSDQTITILENGGNCTPEVSDRILNVLGPTVAITSNSQANPTVITCATHRFQTGDTVVIAGVAGSDADVNGSRVVTRINATSFSVPVNAGVSGGTGGTATFSSVSVGFAAL